MLEQDGPADLPEAVAPPVAARAAPASRPTSGTQPAAPRRTPLAARKAATLTINYDYLVHDLRLLVVLAVVMIVVVLAAYFVFH